MLRVKRPVLAPVLALILMIMGMVPQAYANDFDSDRPGEVAMIGDALIARPVLLASTLVGLGLFTVTIPFTLLGGNADGAAEALVKAPARATFLRCLGCTPAQHEMLKEEKEEKTRR